MRGAALLFALLAVVAVAPPTPAQCDLARDYADAVDKLRLIGAALREYANDHPADTWPRRLTNLVVEGYLDATNLLCIADYSRGVQGGVPDAGVDGFSQHPEVDESGCSFFYEFSGAACSWYWSGSVGDGSVSLVEVDANGDGEAAWGEVKQYQLQHGDTYHPGAYDARIFPSVRCFWFGHGNSNVLGSQTVINLAADRTNVFASHLIWELQANVSLDRAPELRDVFQNRPFGPPPAAPPWTLGRTLWFPLWPRGLDAANMTYRLAEPTGTGQTRAQGSIDANILEWTPDHYSPSNSTIRIELVRDGIAVTNKAYCIQIPGTDGDGLPNAWELERFHTLARDGTLDYDSDRSVDFDEYIAGTCPTNREDYLHISSLRALSDAAAIEWASVTGRIYSILSATNLFTEWKTNGPPIIGAGAQVVVTNPAPSTRTFYRLNVELARTGSPVKE